MSDATEAAERGTDAWKTAVTTQQAAPPDHGDFYTLCGELVGTLRALEQLAGVLFRQVDGYGEGRELRDDAGGDPAFRLSAAVGRLGALGPPLSHAEWVAEQAWSEVGHIGLVEPPGPTTRRGRADVRD